MKIDQHYRESFLDQANPEIWGKEAAVMPRLRSATGRRLIHRVNTTADLRRGYGTWQGRRLPLNNFNENKFLHALRSRETNALGRITKKWIFSTYDHFRFLQFDLDRHGPNVDIRQQIERVEELAKHLNAGIVWTCSPGDIYEGGEHIQGLNAWIKLNRSYAFEDLQRITDRFVEQYQIDAEHCADKKHRLIRLPGQRYMQVVVDPYSFSSIEPEDDRYTMDSFVPHWLRAKPANNQKLLACLSRRPKNSKKKEQQKRPSSTPSLPTNYIGTPGAIEDKGDTFQVIVSACSKALLTLGKDTPLPVLVQHAVDLVRGAITRRSETIDRGDLAESCQERLLRMLATFDQQKAGRIIRPEDQAVYDAVKDVTLKDIEYVLDTFDASDELRQFLPQFLHAVKVCRGRIANRPANNEGCGLTMVEMAGNSRRAYNRLKDELERYIIRLDYPNFGKCSLWSFTDEVFVLINQRRQAA